MLQKIFNKYSNFGQTTKLIIMLVVFVLLFVLSLNSFVNTFFSPAEYKLDCHETSNASYMIKLKPNNYYDVERLPQGMDYVASLIDKVELSFDYLLSATDLIDYDSEYSVEAITRVYGEDGKSILFEKSETLVDAVSVQKENIADYNFRSDVEIDYGHFNDFVRQFKSSYYLTTNSDLSIVLHVKSKVSSDKYKDDLSFDSTSIVTIPLTEKTINIAIGKNDIDTEKSITKKKITLFIIELCLFIITFSLSIMFLYKIIKLSADMLKEKSKYELQLSRILKENDSIIANVTNNIMFSDYEIIDTDSFEELRDVHDNLGSPILYNELVKGKKSIFYIIHDHLLYRYILKSEDYNEEKTEVI